MKAIGIDIGTTSISIVVLDLVKKKVLASRCMDNDSFLRAEQEGQGIQDPTLIFKRTMDALDEIIGNTLIFPRSALPARCTGSSISMA